MNFEKEPKKLKAINLSLKEIKQLSCRKCQSNNYVKAGKNSSGKQQYRCKDCESIFVKNPKVNSHLKVSEDVWLASEIGLLVNQSEARTKISFINIQQDWLKNIAKKFVKYIASTRNHRTIRRYISTINSFSRFIAEQYPEIFSMNQIDRSVIVDFIEYITKHKWTEQHRNKQLENLQVLFETGIRNQWFNLQPYLIYPEDKSKKICRNPRYIPEEVMQQLNSNLDKLPEPIMRMVLVLQECGLRIGELCNLQFDCLRRDIHGDFYLQFMRWKMKKESSIPISRELAKVIQEQQKYIRDNLGQKFNYLFCAREPGNKRSQFIPKPKMILADSFVNALKRLAEQLDIKDSSGNRWNFQSHQFRHTVGTRMVNNDVPMHIIQRYLGHESPTMTQVYAYIHDKTLKKEIAKYHDNRVVNIAGEVVESTNPELDNDLELHLLKKKVLAQSLPNGSCARPIVLGECPHANACFTCGDFRTTVEFLDQHKSQLEETEKLVKNAEENGWKRHAEMNTKVRDNLQKIITTLESGNKDVVSGGDN